MFVVGRMCDHEGIGLPALLPVTKRAREVLDRLGRERYLQLSFSIYGKVCEEKGYDCYIVDVHEYTSRSGAHEVVFTFEPTFKTRRYDVYVFRLLAEEIFERRYETLEEICGVLQELYIDRAIEATKKGHRIGFIAWRVLKGYESAQMVVPVYDYLPTLPVDSKFLLVHLI